MVLSTREKIIDPNRVKETLSEHYAGILFNLDGYYTITHKYDDGVDLSLKFTNEIRIGKRKPIRNPSDELIDIQLKSTTEEKIVRGLSYITYNITVKAYNKLIERWKARKYSICVLIVFILPELEKDWVILDENALSLSNNAYWYVPTDDMDVEPNKKDTSTIKLDIPIQNKLDKDTFKNLFNLLPK